VICGAMLLLSRATGTFQFTNADVLALRLVRMSDGQLMNTGGTTSAVTVRSHLQQIFLFF